MRSRRDYYPSEIPSEMYPASSIFEYPASVDGFAENGRYQSDYSTHDNDINGKL